MRTTLTLDSDVAKSLKSRMAEERAPLKKVINDALRRGLAARSEPEPKKPFRVVAHSFGFKPGIDTTKLNQLLDELDAREFAARLRVRGRRDDHSGR